MSVCLKQCVDYKFIGLQCHMCCYIAPPSPALLCIKMKVFWLVFLVLAARLTPKSAVKYCSHFLSMAAAKLIPLVISTVKWEHGPLWEPLVAPIHHLVIDFYPLAVEKQHENQWLPKPVTFN